MRFPRSNDLVINQSNVAPVHAVIRRMQGALQVADLNSRSGVRVNGRRIDGDVALHPEDKLEVAGCTVTYRVRRPRLRTKPSHDPPAPAGAAQYPPGGADGGHWITEFGLTPREDEMVFWLVEAKSYREIGVITGVTRDCVHQHLKHAYLKLGVEHRLAVTVLVFEWRSRFGRTSSAN